MKLQALILSTAALAFSSASSVERRTASLGDGTIASLIQEFGDGILDTIDDAVGDFSLFDGSFSPFNTLSDFLVPIVNSLLQEILGILDPIDLGLDGEIDLGRVMLPFDVCGATARLEWSMDDIEGISKLEIMDLKITDRDINIGLDETSWVFTFVFKAGYPTASISTGVNSVIYFRICGTSFSMATGGDFILNGPTLETQIKFRGKLSLLGNFVVESANVESVEVDQESGELHLDDTSYTPEESANLEEALGDQMSDEVMESLNGETAAKVSVDMQAFFDRILPIKISAV